MATLAKGLAVVRAFGAERPRLTLSQAAVAVGLSRATARRILLTLSGLGYVEQDGREFFLTPRVMELGFSYLATQSWIDRVLPLLQTLSETSPRLALPRSCKEMTLSMSPGCRLLGL